MVCYNKAWYGIYKAWYGIYTMVQKCGISEVPILLSSSSLLNYRVWWREWGLMGMVVIGLSQQSPLYRQGIAVSNILNKPREIPGRFARRKNKWEKLQDKF